MRLAFFAPFFCVCFLLGSDIKAAKAPSPLDGYVAQPELKGKKTGELELHFSYDVKKTGERDPESGEALDEVYERITTKEGKQLSYELLIGYNKDPNFPSVRRVIKFIKSSGERWVVTEHYGRKGGIIGINQLCFSDGINAEAKEAFDAGNVEGMFLGSNKFDVSFGFYTDNNFFSYLDKGRVQKHFISTRSGVKRDLYEEYENGKMYGVSYLENTAFIWRMSFHPNGKVSVLDDYVRNVERKFDEKGRMISEKKFTTN